MPRLCAQWQTFKLRLQNNCKSKCDYNHDSNCQSTIQLMSLKFIAQKIGRLLPDEETHKIGFVFGSRIFHFTWKIEAFKTHIDPNKSHVMSSHAWIEIYFFPEDLINASIHNRYRKNRKMMGTSHFFHPLTFLYNLMCSAKNKTVRLFHAEKIVFFSSYAYRWYVPFLTKKQSFASHINEANIFCVDLQ